MFLGHRFGVLHPLLFARLRATCLRFRMSLITGDQGRLGFRRLEGETRNLGGLCNSLVAIDHIVRFAGLLNRLNRRPIKLNDGIQVGHDIPAPGLNIDRRNRTLLRKGKVPLPE